MEAYGIYSEIIFAYRLNQQKFLKIWHNVIWKDIFRFRGISIHIFYGG